MNMPKFRAVLEYDGTGYHGWQLQPCVATVQGEVERALERILSRPTRVHAAGRTDAGVHASGQVIHFAAEWSHGGVRLQKACNALLPGDITVRAVEDASPEFHARHSAVSKIYVYRILNRVVRSSLERLYVWHVPYRLDVGAMQNAGSAIMGAHDFAAFGLPTDGTPSTVREILESSWLLDAATDVLTFTVRGTGFLRYMVRSLVGTMVMVGRGKIIPDGFRDILGSRDRNRSGPTAPPTGLTLAHVDYGNSFTVAAQRIRSEDQ